MSVEEVTYDVLNKHLFPVINKTHVLFKVNFENGGNINFSNLH